MVTEQYSDTEQTLTAEQSAVFRRIEETADHVFVTGRAGTGKSYLLTYVHTHTAKKIVVLAPTGVAALIVGGQTIHSFFGLPPTLLSADAMADHTLAPHKIKMVRELDAIVIDEISMVRADLVDAIDSILRRVRKTQAPFGGVQMILFGDPYQLPPVVSGAAMQAFFSEHYDGPYFFHAHAWRDASLTTYELHDVLRQDDAAFTTLLNCVREGRDTTAVCRVMNERVVDEFPEDGAIVLTMTNAVAQRINTARLHALETDVMTHTAAIDGVMEQSAFPTEEHLHLKTGAQVMFVKNDPARRWVNGTVGYVEDMDDDEILVRIDDDVHTVERMTWHKIRYVYNRTTKKVEEEIVSAFTQFPLRLAWAITVHKSQGQTYDAVIIDRGRGAFAHGQMYVALSRCRRLETMYLTGPMRAEDMIVDAVVTAFMTSANDGAGAVMP